METQSVKLYIDYKSPYAYLAKDPAYALERETGVRVEWLPYTLDIPAYLGSAEVDGAGRVLAESRNAHQWRRVKYSYMDVRREANLHGLTILGPKKIFNSRLAHIGMLFARGQDVLRPYNDHVFEAFFRRELNLEDRDALARVLRACGADTHGFDAFLEDEGPRALDAIQREAEANGVFGVPSFLFPNGDLYWGREHLARIRALLGGQA